MFHYIYKIIDTKNGKYYIGRHSTTNLDDGYMGSGIWVSRHSKKKRLEKVILEFCESFDDLLQKESDYISEYIVNEQNMNFNNSSIGASTGSLNIAHRESVKIKQRSRLRENNPMKNGHTEESKEKIRQSVMGKNNPFYGKKHTTETKKKISKKQQGKIWNEEQRKKLSEIRKKQFGGKKPSFLNFSEHTEESKEKIRQSALSREKLCCPHCQISAAPHVAKRWHFNNCKRKI
jgi:hypothetical protein